MNATSLHKLIAKSSNDNPIDDSSGATDHKKIDTMTKAVRAMSPVEYDDDLKDPFLRVQIVFRYAYVDHMSRSSSQR